MLKQVKIKLEALQVYDQGVLDVFYIVPSACVDMSLVLFTVVLIFSLQNIRLDEHVECLLQGLLVLYIETQAVERFLSFTLVCVFGLKGFDFVDQCAADCCLQQPLEGWMAILDVVDEYIEEFMGVLHLSHIYLFSSNKLKTLSETQWRIRHLLRFFKVAENLLELGKDVVCYGLVKVHNWKTQFFDHVKLLNQTIHVASASEVFQTYIADPRPGLALICKVVTNCVILQYPANFSLEPSEQIHQLLKITLIMAGERFQQIHASFPSLLHRKRGVFDLFDQLGMVFDCKHQ